MRVPRRTFAAPFVLTLAAGCAPEPQPHYAPNPPPPQTEPPPKQDPVVVANPPGPVEEPRHTVNPPAPQDPPPAEHPVTPTPPPTRPIVMNPPRPRQPDPEPMDTGAKFDMHWTVSRKGAACTAFYDDACRMPNRKPNDPIPPCNPPAPTAYKCPDNLADGASLKIIKRTGQTQCTIENPPFKCPANAKCNPPPPRVVDCP